MAYLSLNSHAGNTHSRQDDLESLSYVFTNQLHPALIQKISQLKNISLHSTKKKLVKYIRNSSFDAIKKTACLRELAGRNNSSIFQKNFASFVEYC